MLTDAKVNVSLFVGVRPPLPCSVFIFAPASWFWRLTDRWYLQNILIIQQLFVYIHPDTCENILHLRTDGHVYCRLESAGKRCPTRHALQTYWLVGLNWSFNSLGFSTPRWISRLNNTGMHLFSLCPYCLFRLRYAIHNKLFSYIYPFPTFYFDPFIGL